MLVQGKNNFALGRRTCLLLLLRVATPALPTAAMALLPRGSRPGLNITVNVSSTTRSSDMDSLLDGLDLHQFSQL